MKEDLSEQAVIDADKRGAGGLSVVIPAFNEARHIGRAIDSVKTAIAEVGVDRWEIVICDNNSTDETGKIAAEHGARVVFEPHNQIARARNRGAEAAIGEWLIFLDADSTLSADLLRATLRRMRSGKVGGGGARVAFDNSARLAWPVRLGSAFWNFLSRTARWAAGSYVYCRREAWKETGGFHEDWYAAEEIAFSKALKSWCRQRGLRFEIIGESSVRTSPRKLDDYSLWGMVRLLTGLARPGALKNREQCGYWYQRKP